MTLSPSEREAGRIYRTARTRERKQAKRARPKPVIPTAAGQRRPRVREPLFLAHVRTLPCAVGPVGCAGKVEAAHVRTHLPGALPTGLQRKPDDRWALPLCRGHHREQHSGNELRFWRSRGIDPHALAGAIYGAWGGG